MNADNIGLADVYEVLLDLKQQVGELRASSSSFTNVLTTHIEDDKKLAAKILQVQIDHAEADRKMAVDIWTLQVSPVAMRVKDLELSHAKQRGILAALSAVGGVLAAIAGYAAEYFHRGWPVIDLDPHKEAVYEWEDSWPGWDKNHITFKACKELVYSACEAYGVEPPTVIQHPHRSFSWSRPETDEISIQGGKHRDPGGRNVSTVLHEAAHHIGWEIFGDRIQDHGPVFLGIYLDLLTRAKVAPEIALTASARFHGLRWTRPRPRV